MEYDEIIHYTDDEINNIIRREYLYEVKKISNAMSDLRDITRTLNQQVNKDSETLNNISTSIENTDINIRTANYNLEESFIINEKIRIKSIIIWSLSGACIGGLIGGPIGFAIGVKIGIITLASGVIGGGGIAGGIASCS